MVAPQNFTQLIASVIFKVFEKLGLFFEDLFSGEVALPEIDLGSIGEMIK